MEYIIYLSLPFILVFMLLEWIYKKILAFVYWLMGVEETEPEGPGRDAFPDDSQAGGREWQGDGLQAPDEKRQEAGGMAPQERKIPQIIPDVKTLEPEPEPPKKAPQPFIFYEPPRPKTKPKGRGQRDDDYRGR